MLLGSGNLLDKLPLTQTGGVINNTNWMNPSIAMIGVYSFNKTASLPNGYGGKAFYLPMKSGGISGYSFALADANSNGNNGSIATLSGAIGALSGTVGLVGNIISVSNINGNIFATAKLDGSITILSSATANLVSVLNGIGNSVTLTTVNGEVVGAVSGVGSSNILITINADMIGIFDGYGSSTASLSAINLTVNALGNAEISIGTLSSMSGDLKAKGFMIGSTVTISTNLTAKDVWEYYQRTLTTGGSDSFTLEDIASAVWNKVLP
jgi:hypothetical protein